MERRQFVSGMAVGLLGGAAAASGAWALLGRQTPVAVAGVPTAPPAVEGKTSLAADYYIIKDRPMRNTFSPETVEFLRKSGYEVERVMKMPVVPVMTVIDDTLYNMILVDQARFSA